MIKQVKSQVLGPNPIWLISLQEGEEWDTGEYRRKKHENVAIYKPRREASEETNPTHTFTSNFWPAKLRNNLFLSSSVYGTLLWQP